MSSYKAKDIYIRWTLCDILRGQNTSIKPAGITMTYSTFCNSIQNRLDLLCLFRICVNHTKKKNCVDTVSTKKLINRHVAQCRVIVLDCISLYGCYCALYSLKFQQIQNEKRGVVWGFTVSVYDLTIK